MFNTHLWGSRMGSALTAIFCAFQLSAAQAVPFSSDISVTGNTTFDTSASFGGSGDFSLVSGGVTTTSTFTDSSVTVGANPLAGNLTDINDGVGFNGSASVTDDEFLIGFDTAMNVTNNSSDIFRVTINLAFDNLVNADGTDAYADSELVLKVNGVEIFFSDLISDTVYGDKEGGVSTGGAGEELSESGSFSSNFELNPADVLVFDLIWTMEGGDYSGGLANGELSAFLSVTSVEKAIASAPLPATFLLLAMGIILLSVQRRFRIRS